MKTPNAILLKTQVKYLMLLLLLHASQHADAQQWQPFNHYNKYNFLEVSDSLIHTVWVDSVATSDDDTLFYFNKVLDYSKIWSSSLNDTIYEAIELPAGLFNRVCIREDDSLYYFGPGKEWLIKPFGLLNDSWEFSAGVTATITEYNLTETFGQADSVKTIELSNGGSIKISKNVGILAWKIITKPEIKLIGIEGKEGMTIPSFYDYFDYNVGDVFQYNYVTFSEGEAATRNYNIKFSITAKEKKGDTLVYGINGIYKLDFLALCCDPSGNPIHTVSSSSYTKNPVMVDSKDFYANKYFNEQVSTDYTSSFDFYPENGDPMKYSDGSVLYYSLDMRLKNDAVIVKSFKTDWETADPYKLLETEEGDHDTVKYHSIIANVLDGFSYELIPQIGVTSVSKSSFGGSYTSTFVGAVINGDTTGVVNDDADFIVSASEKIISGISVYPNPFADKIHISLAEPGTVEIYDLSGVLKYHAGLGAGDHTLDLGFLSAGAYLLRQTEADNVYRAMIVRE